MFSRLTIVLYTFILVGCISTAPEIVPTATATPSCGDWQVSDAPFNCLLTNDGFLIQSGNEQITLRAYDASIVVFGTIFVTGDDVIRIAVLEGDAVIGARGQNRVVSVGREVDFSIVDNRADAPSDIRYIDSLPDNLPLENLARSLDESTFIIVPTATAVIIPTEQNHNCSTPENWIGQYTVEAGDTLANIANNYNLTVGELAEGNCLGDISRIISGQELNVPADNDSEQIDTPISISFLADVYQIEPGTCTILRWDTSGTGEIFLENEPMGISTSQEICPEETQSYSLTVVLSDGQEETRELTISVRE